MPTSSCSHLPTTTIVPTPALLLLLLLLSFSRHYSYHYQYCLFHSQQPAGANTDDWLAAHQLMQSKPPSQVNFTSSLVANSDKTPRQLLIQPPGGWLACFSSWTRLTFRLSADYLATYLHQQPVQVSSLLSRNIKQSSQRFWYKQEFPINTFLVISCQMKIGSLPSCLCLPHLICCYSFQISVGSTPATIYTRNNKMGQKVDLSIYPTFHSAGMWQKLNQCWLLRRMPTERLTQKLLISQQHSASEAPCVYNKANSYLLLVEVANATWWEFSRDHPV